MPRELDVIQRWMQAVITHPAGVERGVASDAARSEIAIDLARLNEVVHPSSRLSPAERIRVYANAYYGRLIDCLREEFAVVARTIGDEAFNEFAFGFLQAHPSRSYTLNELGRQFPRYLAASSPEAGGESTHLAPRAGAGHLAERDAYFAATHEVEPLDFPAFLVDLATLEATINEVFDAPGVEGESLLRAEDLLAIPPESWASVRLEPVRCLRLLKLRFPVNAYFTAMREADTELPERRDEFVAVFRRDFVVRRFELSRAQLELLEALSRGVALSDAIISGAALFDGDDSQLAASLRGWFTSWTEAGLIHRVS